MKHVLITGGATRIGRIMAEHLLERGYHVTIVYHSSVVEYKEIKKKYKNYCQGIKCDLSKSNAAKIIFKKIKRLDLLINNAAIFKNDHIDNLNFEEIFAVNTKAPILLSQQFVKHFDQGQIINILDTWASDLPNNFFSYTMSKLALENFTKLSAQQLPPTFKINGISLGFTLHKEGFPLDFFTQMQKIYPSSPERVCEALDLMLSSEIKSGQIIEVCKWNTY